MSITLRIQRAITTAHTRAYEASNGAIGQSLLGAPCLLLTTTGAKSSEPRTTPLGYANDGEDYVLIASNNGSDRTPSWLVNLRQHDEVELQIGSLHLRGKARVLQPGERQYDRLFGLANANCGGRYYAYQQRTTRPIPVVVVTPEG